MTTATLTAPDLNRRYTADELLLFPREWRYELVEGQLREMSPTGDAHGAYTIALGVEIALFVRTHNFGRCYAAETGFLIARNPDTVLAPDFAFVSRERRAGPLVDSYVPVVPDLVLETRSPSDRKTKVEAKMKQWITVGARMALELDPRTRVLSVYQPGVDPLALGPSDTLEGGDVLPGFFLPLFRLFAD